MEILEESLKSLLAKLKKRESDKSDSVLSYLIKSETSIDGWFNREFGSQIDAYLRSHNQYFEYTVYPRQKINNKKFDLIVYSKASIKHIVCSRIIKNWALPYEQIDSVITDIDKLNELYAPEDCNRVIIIPCLYVVPSENNVHKNYLGWLRRKLESHEDLSVDTEQFHKRVHDGIKMIRKLDIQEVCSFEVKNDVFSKLVLTVFSSKL